MEMGAVTSPIVGEPVAVVGQPVAVEKELRVDHIYSPSRLSETWVLFRGKSQAQMMYADANWKQVMKQGCKALTKCRHPIDGLRIPIVQGSVDGSTGSLSPNGKATATLVFEWPCCANPLPCCCYLPTLKAQVVSGD